MTRQEEEEKNLIKMKNVMNNNNINSNVMDSGEDTLQQMVPQNTPTTCVNDRLVCEINNKFFLKLIY